MWRESSKHNKPKKLSVSSIWGSLKFGSVSLSLQLVDYTYWVAVQKGAWKQAVVMMWCASSYTRTCSWLHQPSICVFKRLSKRVFVHVSVKRVEPPDFTTCAGLCQQLNVCKVLFLFGTLSALSVCNGLIIYCTLLKADSSRACDLPAWLWMHLMRTGRKEQTGLQYYNAVGF